MAATAPASDFPVFWLLSLLLMTAGLPFFVVSTMSPMLQRWFSWTGHPSSEDPYFLYAASNAGSMLGLLAYPFVLEPLATLLEQSLLWHVLYGGLIILTGASAWWMFHASGKAASGPSRAADVEEAGAKVAKLDTRAPGLRRRLEWIVLAFIPSSLMLGLTTYVSTDIASGPLLWVVPLALYLLSFILVFAKRPVYLPPWMGRGMCLVGLVVTVTFLAGLNHPLLLLIPLHLLFYFVAIMVAHGRLARRRPAPNYLTEYFLWMSIGGVLGGVFNALIAPLIFTRIIEYILVVALACAVREVGAWEKQVDDPRRDLWMPLIPGALLLVLILVPPMLGFDFGRLSAFIIFAPVALIIYSFVERPRRFALGLLVMIGIGGIQEEHQHRTLYQERNFFGTIAVADELDGAFRVLIDGNTIHGRERLDAKGCEPLSYYHSEGPMGALFEMHGVRHGPSSTARVALVGVGIGSLACYGRPAEHWDLFEINPAVVKVAEDPALFTVLQKAPVGSYTFIVGDARLRLAQVDATYDIIIVDAFSSGSIPIHLLTLEAIELYRERLNEGGIMAFNISNRLLDLEPVFANISAAAGLKGYSLADQGILEEQVREGKEPSHWILLARDEASLGTLVEDPRARVLTPTGARHWTDAFSNITTIIHLSW